jgi:hypothetical protein
VALPAGSAAAESHRAWALLKFSPAFNENMTTCPAGTRNGLSHGADRTKRSTEGKTAADLAAEHGHAELAQRLRAV